LGDTTALGGDRLISLVHNQSLRCSVICAQGILYRSLGRLPWSARTCKPYTVIQQLALTDYERLPWLFVLCLIVYPGRAASTRTRGEGMHRDGSPPRSKTGGGAQSSRVVGRVLWRRWMGRRERKKERKRKRKERKNDKSTAKEVCRIQQEIAWLPAWRGKHR